MMHGAYVIPIHYLSSNLLAIHHPNSGVSNFTCLLIASVNIGDVKFYGTQGDPACKGKFIFALKKM
jgi:hypothetical protein